MTGTGTAWRMSQANAGPADREAAIRALAQQRLGAPDYFAWLDRLHGLMRPATYLEIGIAQGRSLARVRPPTAAIGIDPFFRLANSIAAPVRLYRTTSDAFFAEHDPAAILGAPIDLAFIDGLHTFEQTFRDIVNVARFCHEGSVIAVHDVLPVDEIITRREAETDFWTGDVWKVAPMVGALMPQAEMLTLPAHPSGLMLIRNAAAAAPISRRHWIEAEAELMARPFPESFEALWAEVGAERLDEAGLRRWLPAKAPSRSRSSRLRRLVSGRG